MQLDLFEKPPEPLGPAEPHPDWLSWRSNLPEELYLGTSSWSFPGWTNLVYRGEAQEQELAAEGLAHYARHPLFRTVGLDRTFYAPVPEETYAGYAKQLPPDFRMLVKAPEMFLVRRYPDLPRYGQRAGKLNPFFLDVEQALAQFVEPAQRGLGLNLGPVLFQFPPQNPAELGGARSFARQLRAFLEALPGGLDYAVELRNKELLDRPYIEALNALGVSHCLNVHPTMEAPWNQARRFGKPVKRMTVIRWMMGRIADYAKARARYAPFDRILDPAPETLRGLVTTCRAALRAGHKVFVIVNNKAEGSAPLTVARLAQQLGQV